MTQTDKQTLAPGEAGLTKWPMAVALVIALLLALLPLVVSDAFTLQVLLLAIMFGALGACWNLVGGFLGRISFGHGVFIGVGPIRPCCCCSI
ncbi:hypothetical protein D556_0616 [Bordetella holmesii 41130]|nr:hypothetical protein D556_0616 [Bordetella holmesii 41130]